MHKTVAHHLTVIYARHLSTRGVKVDDRERLAAAMPDTVTAQWVARYELMLADLCFSTYSPAEVRMLADALRADPERSWARPVDTAPSNVPDLDGVDAVVAGLEEASAALDAIAADPLKTAAIRLTFCAFGGQGGLDAAMRCEITSITEGHSGELADILMLPGVATFPNRVPKQDILREIRNAGSCKKAAPPSGRGFWFHREERDHCFG